MKPGRVGWLIPQRVVLPRRGTPKGWRNRQEEPHEVQQRAALGEEQPHTQGSDRQKSSAAGKGSKWNRNQQQARDWSIWQTRREWESQDCSAWKREGTTAWWEGVKMKELYSGQWCPVRQQKGNEQKLQFRTFCVEPGKSFSCLWVI